MKKGNSYKIQTYNNTIVGYYMGTMNGKSIICMDKQEKYCVYILKGDITKYELL